jgi:hypothetical protein
MNEADFRETLGLLETAGHVVLSSRYDAAAFGSWFVEVEGEPRARVIWDGKDRWLIVQTARQGRDWKDSWIEKQASLQTPAQAVRKVVEHTGEPGA